MWSRKKSSSSATTASSSPSAASHNVPSSGNTQTQEAQARVPASTEASLTAALVELAQAEETGLATLEELETQRETLARIQRKVDEVEAHADRGATILRRMRSIFSPAAWRRGRPDPPAAVIAKREAERAAKTEVDDAAAEARARERESRDAEKYGLPPPSAGARRSASAGAGAFSGVPPIGDASLLTGEAAARVAVEDELLSQISRNLGGLKSIGHALNDELVRQESMIDDLGGSMDRVSSKIDANRSAADKLAR